MQLDKEIQSKFENDYQKVIVNVIYTYGWVTSLLKKRLAKHQITLQQYNVLRILRGQYPKPATVNLLKERMLDKMSDASRIVDRLVQKGLATRTINVTDRRAVDIMITDTGLETLRNLDPVITPDDILRVNLSLEEVTELNSLLDKMRGC